LFIALIAVLFAFLMGCSTAQKQNLAAPVSDLASLVAKIGTLSVQDAQTALADVHAHGDVDLAALSCYPAVIDFIQNKDINSLQAPTIDGVLSVNQLKRDVIISGQDKNSPLQIAVRKLHVACAAYAGDEARFAAEFSAMIGGASHGVPAIVPMR